LVFVSAHEEEKKKKVETATGGEKDGNYIHYYTIMVE
jgi:hypothetical protein